MSYLYCCGLHHSSPLLSGLGAACVLLPLIHLMPGFTPNYSKLLLTHTYVTLIFFVSVREREGGREREPYIGMHDLSIITSIIFWGDKVRILPVSNYLFILFEIFNI